MEDMPHLASVHAMESSAVLMMPDFAFRALVDDPEPSIRDMREAIRYLALRGLMTDVFKCFPKLKSLPLDILTVGCRCGEAA